MVYNLISSRSVIAKVLADLNIKEESLRISDMIEWCGEAIEKIGAVTQLIHKTSGENGVPYLKLKDYQAALPSDLHHLAQAAFSLNNTNETSWQPMVLTTGSFGVKSDDKLFTLDTLQYAIKPGYIVTSKRDGYLKLSYYAIPKDKDGYPLIPDLISYQEAIYWYITMKLKYPDYMNGRMNREIYYDIKRSWNFYCKQAYAEALMPSGDAMKTIQNVWLRLIPEIDSHDTYYYYSNKQEEIYNNN